MTKLSLPALSLPGRPDVAPLPQSPSRRRPHFMAVRPACCADETAQESLTTFSNAELADLHRLLMLLA